MNDMKKEYTSVEIEITPISAGDVIRTSSAFDGIEDRIASWF